MGIHGPGGTIADRTALALIGTLPLACPSPRMPTVLASLCACQFPYWGLGFSDVDKGGHFKQAKELPDQIREHFIPSGETHLSAVNKDLRGWLMEHKRGRALEFGCGLGRLALAWSTRFRTVDCVDQSVYHQEAGKAAIASIRQPRHGSISFLVSTPDLLQTVQGARYDFIHTVKVMQHMIAPQQQVYLEQFCDLLVPGGKAWLHFLKGQEIHRKEPPAHRNCNISKILQADARTKMQMHPFDGHSIAQLVEPRGCNVSAPPEPTSAQVGDLTLQLIVILTKRGSGPATAHRIL